IGRVAEHFLYGVKALLENRRDAGENKDVANIDDGGKQGFGGEQLGAFRNIGHAQARFVDLASETLAHAPFDVGVRHDFETKAVGDALDGYIVMGWTDAAGGKNIIITSGKGRYFLADQPDLILNRRDFLNFNTEAAQLGAKKMRIDVLGLAGQDLIADNDNAGGFRHTLIPSAVNARWPVHRPHRSNSLQLMKKLHFGLAQTYLHF